MIQSLIVYTFTALILVWLAHHAAWRERCRLRAGGVALSCKCPELIACILVFAAVAGMRYGVGVDHLSYLQSYKEIEMYGHSLSTTVEPLFHNVGKLFVRLGWHYVFYFAFWAALQIGLLIYASRKNKEILPYVMLYLMLGPYFLSFMNGIRQTLAECIIVVASHYIVQRKLSLYLFVVFIATLIHKSAILAAPLYFLPFGAQFWENRRLTISVLVICVLAGGMPFISGSLTQIIPLLDLIGYSNYAAKFDYFVSKDSIASMAWGPARLSMFMIGLFSIFTYPKIKIFFSRDPFVSVVFVMTFIGECLFGLLANTSYLFLRPVEYLTIFKLLAFGYLIAYLVKTKQTLLSYLIIGIGGIFMYWNIYKSVGADRQFTLYKFFFEFS